MAGEKSDFLKKMKAAFGRPLVLIILLFILVNLFLISRYLSKRQKLIPQVQKPTAEEELPLYQDEIQKGPTPRPLPQGKIGFTVGQSDKSGPQFRRGFIDPYDPKVGERQAISITVKDEAPVRSVSVAIISDNGSKKYQMDLVEGTELDGRWQVSWEVKDTHLYTYNVVLEAVGKRGAQKVEMTLR